MMLMISRMCRSQLVEADPNRNAGAAVSSSWRLAEYTFVDYATQLYLLVVALLILVFHGRTVESWPLLVLAHMAGMGLIHAAICLDGSGRGGGVLRFLRHFYPVLLYAGFYRETGALNQMFATGYLDAYVIRLEQTLFGFQPCLEFMRACPYPMLSEMFYAAYFSYYVMISGVGLALFWRKREWFFHYVSVISFVFYVCYLIYIFLPIAGPRVFSAEHPGFEQAVGAWPAERLNYPAAVTMGPFYQVMALIYRGFEIAGAAFPSSHVAVAIGTLWFSFRYLRAARWMHLVGVILLCLSTVYCRYHYALDVAGGVVTAGILLPVGNWLYAVTRMQRSERPEAAPS